MAEGKNKVIVYTDWIEIFEALEDDEAGRLIKHFFRYVNDQNPSSDRLTEISFIPIKQTLKRDLERYLETCNKNSNNGKLGGRPRKANESEENPKKANGFLENPTKAKKADNDNDNDNDNDILLKKETKDIIRFDFKKSLVDLGVSESVAKDWMAVRNKKKASNTETAFKQIEKELRKSNIHPNECITEAVARSWSGFKAEWMSNTKQNNNGISTKQTMDERIAEAKRRASEKRSGQMPSIWSEPESFSDYETL